MWPANPSWDSGCANIDPAMVLITQPSDRVLSVDDCKTMLQICGNSQDAMIEAAMDAIVSKLDPASEGYLGRALRPQTWEYRSAGFVSDRIELPFPPLLSIVSFSYYDESGTPQTLSEETGYRLFNFDGWGKSYVAPPYQQSWPNARCDDESVRIRFQSGYSIASQNAPDRMPRAIKTAIALGVRSLLSNIAQNLYLSERTVEGIGTRRFVVSDAANAVIQTMMDELLATYRVWG